MTELFKLTLIVSKSELDLSAYSMRNRWYLAMLTQLGRCWSRRKTSRERSRSKGPPRGDHVPSHVSIWPLCSAPQGAIQRTELTRDLITSQCYDSGMLTMPYKTLGNLQHYLLQHNSCSSAPSTNIPPLERSRSHKDRSIQLCCTARNNLPLPPLLCSVMEEIALSR